MTKKELKRWNDKHFQICLTLLQQEAACTDGMVNKVEMGSIISRANKMIKLLHEREKNLIAKYEARTRWKNINLMRQKIKAIIFRKCYFNQSDLTDKHESK